MTICQTRHTSVVPVARPTWKTQYTEIMLIETKGRCVIVASFSRYSFGRFGLQFFFISAIYLLVGFDTQMKTIWLKKRCRIKVTRDADRRKLKSEFFVDGKLHNETGPAIVYHTDSRSAYYYLNDELELWSAWKVKVWFKRLRKLMLQFRQSHYFLFAVLCELNMFIGLKKCSWIDAWLFGAGTILMLVMAVTTSKRASR